MSFRIGNGGMTVVSVVTAIILLTVIAIAAILDALAEAKFGPQATISYVVITLSVQYPIIPFLCGIVLGHFFWPQHIAGIVNSK